MNKLAIVLLCFSVQLTFACDVCSCSSAGSTIDLLNIKPQSYIQSALIYKKYSHSNTLNNLRTTHQIQNNWQIAYSPIKWVSMNFIFPIIWQQQWYKSLSEQKALNQQKIGIGDVSFQTNFNVFNKEQKCRKNISHRLNAGIGIKLPTGKTRPSTNENWDDFIFGTKSVDFLFSAMYSMQINKWMLLNSLQYKLNTQNKYGLKYGDLTTYQLTLGYSIQYKKMKLMPSIAMNVEHAATNIHNRIIQPKSGYNRVSLNYGIMLNTNQFLFDVQIQNPIIEKTKNVELKQKSSIVLSIQYVFPTKKIF